METQSPPPKPKKNTIVAALKGAAAFRSTSHTEDTYLVSNLRSSEKKALQELKSLIAGGGGASPVIWGVPLVNGDDGGGGDVILLKFLRARDFNTMDTLEMLRRSLRWRDEFGAEGIVDEELGFRHLEGTVSYMRGHDRKGHPVCYNAYGVFRDKELYQRTLGDEEKVKGFLRWRVQVLERSIRLLSFKPGGVNSLVQVTDLKDMPKRELRLTSSQILALFQDNYPEMVALKIFINVPWFFSMLYSMIRPFLTQRTTSKFVISKEGDAAAGTLHKYIKLEDIPLQYGGLWREGEVHQDPAMEFTVKGGETVNIQIEGLEVGATITWDLVVVGWELEYGAEFMPVSERSYAMVVHKSTKMVPTDAAVRDRFTAAEPGKLVLVVDNTASPYKKAAAYRYSVSAGATLAAVP